MMTNLPLMTLALSALLAQIPNPAAAIGAAKDAKAKTEAAQKKNSEALDQKPAAPQPTPPAAPSGAPPASPPPAPQGAKSASGEAGYSYDPAGRRDPFVSLTARGGDLPAGSGARPAGAPGLLVNEITVKGVLKSPKGGLIALVQSPDNRTYIMRAGDKVFDGTVKAITQDAVVFSQDVNDPLSLVKQREVRKAIRPEAR
jgi:type IV pilus assembly protein PilP